MYKFNMMYIYRFLRVPQALSLKVLLLQPHRQLSIKRSVATLLTNASYNITVTFAEPATSAIERKRINHRGKLGQLGRANRSGRKYALLRRRTDVASMAGRTTR